jgi:superfamily II DNA or RNA helicase
VLADAHRELIDLRAGSHADAGGLVVAADKEHAEQLAARLARISGEQPEIVTSDAPDASARIARFAAGSGTWLVSVLMVSEGVDVPRLRVGVYATSARTARWSGASFAGRLRRGRRCRTSSSRRTRR